MTNTSSNQQKVSHLPRVTQEAQRHKETGEGLKVARVVQAFNNADGSAPANVPAIALKVKAAEEQANG